MVFDDTGLNETQRDFFQWIVDREDARIGKSLNLPKPWTKNRVIQQYKFCNVRREDDRVTLWIKENWRDPFEGHPNMWFAMCVARIFNWPETLDMLEFPELPFEDLIGHWRGQLKWARDEQKKKIFTGAYLVSTNGISMDKVDYVLDIVLMPLWKGGRAPLANLALPGGEKDTSNPVVNGDTLESYHKFLTQFNGMGSFMAGQVIADLKYTPVLAYATDWWDFAPLGPGSTRGLNRYFGRDKNASLKQSQGLKEMKHLQTEVENRLGFKLDIHDIQNCCCEYDKYERVLHGEGKPRSLYPGV